MTTTPFDNSAVVTQPIRVRKKSVTSAPQPVIEVFQRRQIEPFGEDIEFTQPILRRRGGTDAEIRRRKLASSLSVATCYLLAITLAEALTTILIPVVGVVLHAALLTAIFLHAATCRDLVKQRMVAALSLAPLIRIVSLSMPLDRFVYSYGYFLVGFPLFLSAYLVARYNNFRPADIGFRLSVWPLQILFGLFGILLGYIEYLILRPAPLASVFTIEQIWMPGLILVVFTGLLEEVIFRGIMQRTFIHGLGRWPGLLFVSLIFSVLHMGYHSVLDVLFVFGVALLFGYVSMRSNSIFGVTIAHGLTNFCLFLVFPFLVG